MCVCGWESLKQTHRDKLLMGCTVQMHHCTLSLIRRRTEGGNRGRKGTESLEESEKRSWCTAGTFLFASLPYSAHQRYKHGRYSVSTLPPPLLHYISSLPGTSVADLNSFQPLDALTASGMISFGLVSRSAQKTPPPKTCYHQDSPKDKV